MGITIEDEQELVVNIAQQLFVLSYRNGGAHSYPAYGIPGGYLLPERVEM